MATGFRLSRRRRTIGALGAMVALVAGTLVQPMSAQAATPVSVSDAVARILADTNSLRAAGGLAPLTESSALDTVAQDWSAQMFANGAMTHNPNYSTQIPSGWTGAAENIAYGYTYTTVVEAWHQSAGHYANIMGNYDAIGIGYYELNGQRYFTQDFGQYSSVPGLVGGAAPTPSSTPTSTVTPPPAPATGSSPDPVAGPQAAPPSVSPPVAAPAAPMKCVRWSHHKCTKYQVIKKQTVKKKAVVRHASRRR